MQVCPEETAKSGTMIQAFSSLVFNGIQPLIGDNASAVKSTLAMTETMFAAIASGKGQFKGLSKDEFDQAKDRVITETISSLSAILGCSARFAVCTALLQLYSIKSQSHNSIASAA